MLIDIMYPLLSVLESNQDAPVREAIGWELRLADSSDDADLRDAYADRLHEWGCTKRESDVRYESVAIRCGGTVPIRRHAPLLVIHYPPGVSNAGTDDNPVLIDHADIARDLVGNIREGSIVTMENTRCPMTNEYEWDIKAVYGVPPEVVREKP